MWEITEGKRKTLFKITSKSPGTGAEADVRKPSEICISHVPQVIETKQRLQRNASKQGFGGFILLLFSLLFVTVIINSQTRRFRASPFSTVIASDHTSSHQHYEECYPRALKPLSCSTFQKELTCLHTDGCIKKKAWRSALIPHFPRHSFFFFPHLTRALPLQRWRYIKLSHISEKERHFLSVEYISHISVVSNCAGCVRCGQGLYLTALHNCIKMAHIYATLCKDIWSCQSEETHPTNCCQIESVGR